VNDEALDKVFRIRQHNLAPYPQRIDSVRNVALDLDLSTGGNDSFGKMVPAVDRCVRRINDAPAGFYSAEARESFSRMPKKAKTRLLTRHPYGFLRVDVLQCTTSVVFGCAAGARLRIATACLQVFTEPRP